MLFIQVKDKRQTISRFTMIEKIKHIHITAICGTGMGAFSGMLKSRGYHVTGSDQNIYPPMSTLLQKLDIPVCSGYKRENIMPRPDLVIIGNAIRRDNPEALAVMEEDIPFMSMPEALSRFFLDGKKSIVVSGTHGKTTTSALASWLLHFAEKEPSFLVGGILRNFDSSYMVGNGEYFVVEGDEYDTAFFDKGPKFLHYKPFYTIVTSIEFDHADIYRDLEHVKESFLKLMRIIPPEGQLVCSADYDSIRDVVARGKPACPVCFYGEGDVKWRADDVSCSSEGMKFSVFKENELWAEFISPMYGRHNLANILAVLAVMDKIGIPVDVLQEGVRSFKGIKRRQEVIDVIGGVPIIDDFAHHPTAVRETLTAVKMRFPGKKIWVLFEPRTNTSRRKFFQETYPGAFKDADRVLIAPVFNQQGILSEDLFDVGRLAEDITALGVRAQSTSGAQEIVDIVSGEVSSGDVILIMSNGAFENIYQTLPQMLKKRFGREIHA